MFNFSGKGNTGWFSGGSNIGSTGTVHVQGQESRLDPADNVTGSIDFWYQNALQLRAKVNKVTANRDLLHQGALERLAINDGLRAVIRDLLKTLRDTNPTHPLLDKNNRDRIFYEFEKAAMVRILHGFNSEPWSPRVLPLENTSE